MREVTHYSGDYMEKDIFPVRYVSSDRGKKAKPSSEAQKCLNDKNAARRLTWLIQENFGTNDLYLGLSYPADFNLNSLSDRLFKNWLRRIRNKFKSANLEFKYVYTAEIGDKNHRLHHHVICSGELGAELLKNEWNKQFESYKKSDRTSFVHCQKLKFTRTGLAGIAFYTCKDPQLAYRSYTCSKNLRHPRESKRDGRISAKKLKELREDYMNASEFEKLFPGYEFVDADPHFEIYDIDSNGEAEKIDFPYITVRMFRKDSKYILRDLDRM